MSIVRNVPLECWKFFLNIKGIWGIVFFCENTTFGFKNNYFLCFRINSQQITLKQKIMILKRINFDVSIPNGINAINYCKIE